MIDTYELIAPCHFGLESVLKREIYDLGYDIVKVEDGKVTFIGDADAIARANIFLRTAERVLLKVGEFRATTFTELFDNVNALEWEHYIPKNGKFWVTKANSINSKLFSSSDIQSIVKKAIVERLKKKYAVSWFDEDGDSYPIRVSIMKEIRFIREDTGQQREKLLFQKRLPRLLLCSRHGSRTGYLLTHSVEVEHFLLKLL